MQKTFRLRSCVGALAAAGIISLALAGAALAEVGTSSPRAYGAAKANMATSSKSMMKEERQDARGMKKDTKMTKEETRAEKAREKIDNYIDRSVRKLTNAITILERTAKRVDEAIVKFKGKGVNTVESEGLMVIARGKIAAAKDAVAKLPSLKGKTGTDVKARTEEVKRATKTATEAVRAAHKAIVDAINSLKPGFNKVKRGERATTSPEEERNGNATSSER